MKTFVEYFLPAKVDNTIRGGKLPFYILLLIATIGTVRSLIHIFSPDGGAGSIAGMNLSVTGADGIVLAFVLWGSAQLIYALIQWVVILRYWSLVPFMWCVQLLEILLRMLVGRFKPVAFAHTPPGQIGNYIYALVSGLILVFYLWDALKEVKHAEGNEPN
jgi:hypothetical protein